MRSLSRAATAFGLLGLAIAAVLGATLGLRLGASGSEPGLSEVRVADPALVSGPPEHARRSSGGFTGFGAAALAGEVITGGELVSVESNEAGGTLVFRDAGRETSVRYLNGTKLFELVDGADLGVGDTVMLRLEGDEVTGLLRIPAGLRTEDGS